VSTRNDTFDAAMRITDQVEADDWLRRAVDARLRILSAPGMPEVTREHVERSIRDDLAYFAGYYGDEVRERVERLFDCAHPYFAKIADNGPSTFEEALRMGMAIRRAMNGDTEGES
jgi:hypothetical protein